MDFETSDSDIHNIEKITQLVRKADYAKALRLTQELKRRHKNKAIYQIREAVLIGDQETSDPKVMAKNKKTAAKILAKFIKHADKFDENTRSLLLNEYFWFSEKPRDQYRLGQRLVKFGILKGFYSQGVGAAFYAYQWMKKGEVSKSQKWAAISEKAWIQYFQNVTKDYYNSYCWYALALGLGQKFEKMYEAFKTAETLSQKPASYSEFKYFKHLVFDSLSLNSSKKFEAPLKLPAYWYVYNQDFRDVLLKNQNALNIGDTKRYYKEAQNLPKIFPREAYAHIKALALWGDWGHHLSEDKERVHKTFAVQKYKALEKSHVFDNWRVRDIYENELYFHAGRFLDQYNLGKRTKKLRPALGDFSMGVGSSELAHHHQSIGEVQKAKKWARISMKHWQSHYKFRPVEIEGDYFYIQALFISGKKTLARKLALDVMARSNDFENAAWASLFKRWGAYEGTKD